ncbi:MAG: Glycosyl transferase family 2 [Candidatus Woesebacteria bacterium GW2011_GWA1_37_8]|uniref:Glycosyl transferase family 2 n=1 Tax=Candidatus Woesebacteria bacterium GW2011_GWA1_37_8 TaxID=1618546 RepID=A0A0G0HPW6_9BACT|nr:MAG: Glycosyl transferase family 2 [Microgenomates group bacterium GW2011_GWC1_37_12b]KKQ44252.1 MAG: Glycosyl transferase family 2 [Candidatus Woesebacteria bacterium GW2011_GWA1_37_8]
MKIWGHTLVRNEERYLWYSVTSVIDYLDKLLLWDTGSADNTLKIIKELQKKYTDKILFREVGSVDKDNFTKIRQQMLDETQADWVFILDGDEVWWKESISKLRIMINHNGNKLETIVNRYCNLVGDLYHFQPEIAGRYKIDDYIGHVTIRALSTKIPGLNFSRPHGQQGIFDEDNKLIQERDKIKRLFMNDLAYLHFTHLIRSDSLASDRDVIKRDMKFKYELGNEFTRDYYYPESFFIDRSDYIFNPWTKRSKKYFINSQVREPIRIVKRKYFRSNKSGY